MNRLQSNFKNMVLALSLIAMSSAFLLSFVFNLTSEPIENAKFKKQEKAILAVLPAFDELKEVIVNEETVYQAYFKNKYVGMAVATSSPNGFSGDIRLLVGFDAEGNIYNYEVLEQKETPGLGSKIDVWFKAEKETQNILGRNPSKKSVKLKNDGGDIDAITSSTITSRAFLDCVLEAHQFFLKISNDSLSIDSVFLDIKEKDSLLVDTLIEYQEEIIIPTVNIKIPKVKEVDSTHKDSTKVLKKPIKKSEQDTVKVKQDTQDSLEFKDSVNSLIEEKMIERIENIFSQDVDSIEEPSSEKTEDSLLREEKEHFIIKKDSIEEVKEEENIDE